MSSSKSRPERRINGKDPFSGPTLDQLFVQPKQAYRHLPPAQRRRVIARIIRRHVWTRLIRQPSAGGEL